MVLKYGVSLTFTQVLCIATTKANLTQLFAPQSIVTHARSAGEAHVDINPKMFRESLLILLQTSLPTIMYHLHLYSNWKIVNEHLGKCADECDI